MDSGGAGDNTGEALWAIWRREELVVEQRSDLTRDARSAFQLEVLDAQVFGCVIGLIGFLVCLTGACSLLFVTTVLT